MLQLSVVTYMLGPLALLAYGTFKSYQKSIRRRYCHASDEILDWLAQHGPYIEASAGLGWLSWKLQQRGIESLPFDIFVRGWPADFTSVGRGSNGTFEDRYPNHTLLIAHGIRDTEASVEKYTGNKVVIAGYHFHEQIISNGVTLYRSDGDAMMYQEYILNPEPTWMMSNGWLPITTKECDRPGTIVKRVYIMYVRIRLTKRFLILGHARHGKDTVAELLRERYGLQFDATSKMVSDLLIFDKLKDRHGYINSQQCFDDRANHREEWFQEIAEYNKDDKTRLVTKVLGVSYCYVGLRNLEEFEACLDKKIFDMVIWVDASQRVVPEGSSLFNIPMDHPGINLIINNDGNLESLIEQVDEMVRPFL